MSYTHSETFHVLKSTTEQIQINLTSAQYLHTLDFFLWQAIKPIAYECPHYFNNFMAKCLAAQTRKPGTKYTSDNKKNLPGALLTVLLSETGEERWENAKKMHLNRGLLFGLLSMFVRTTARYTKVAHPLSKASEDKYVIVKHKTLADLGMRDTERLYEVCRQVRYWQEQAHHFKSLIVQKFLRLAMNQAQKTYVDYSHAVPLDDIAMVFTLVVNKAIDRCDARLGVLTRFIQNWFPSARSTIADMVKDAQGEESLDSMIEDSPSPSLALGSVDPDESTEQIQHIAFRAQIADPEGLIRISMGIPQYVNNRMRNTLLAHAMD